MWSLWSLSSSYVFKPIYLMYSASSIACCNFIVFYFWSLDEVVWDLRNHVRLSVLPSISETVPRKKFITFFLKHLYVCLYVHSRFSVSSLVRCMRVSKICIFKCLFVRPTETTATHACLIGISVRGPWNAFLFIFTATQASWSAKFSVRIPQLF